MQDQPIDLIESAWENRDLLKTVEVEQAIRSTIELLDQGRIRVAEPKGDGWQVNEWVKKPFYCFSQFRKWKP